MRYGSANFLKEDREASKGTFGSSGGIIVAPSGFFPPNLSQKVGGQVVRSFARKQLSKKYS